MILIVAAMDSEVRDLIINFKEKSLFNDKKYYYGTINNKNVLVLITGVGKTNASACLASLLMVENVVSIINVGFVGAKGNFEIGEVVLVEKTIYGDVDVTPFTNYELGQIPKMPKYFKSDEITFKEFNKTINKTAALKTQDKFVLKTSEDNLIFDMEGASFYHVSHLFNKPIIAIKVVSDLIGKESQLENYLEFEKNSSNIIKEIIYKVI